MMSGVSFAVGGLVSYLGIVLAIGVSAATLVVILSAVARGVRKGDVEPNEDESPLSGPQALLLCVVSACAIALALRLSALSLLAPLHVVTRAMQPPWWLDSLLVGLPASMVASLVAWRLGIVDLKATIDEVGGEVNE